MDSPKRILILPSWYPPDGGYFFKEHSEAIRDLGWETDVLVNRVVGVRKLMQAGLGALSRTRIREENGLRVMRAITLKIPGSERRNILRWSDRVLKLYKRYRKINGDPSLILCHSVTWAGYAASLIREKFGVPYIIVEHRSFFVFKTPEARAMVKDYYLPFFEKAYRDCEQLVPVSESLTSGLKDLMPWIGEKISVIPNMIREDMFLPPEAPRKVDPFVFFWAGRLEHVKGLDVLVEAAALLKAQLNEKGHAGFKIRLAGKGSLRTQLEEEAARLGLSGEVDFLGRISREEMQKEMKAASCFVLPTRYEAFGAVLIEAMASGLPVIATRSGGPEHIVTPENGILVEVGDVDGLTSAMEQMIRGFGDFDQEKIRSHCIRNYGQRAVMENYDKLFSQVIGQ